RTRSSMRARSSGAIVALSTASTAARSSSAGRYTGQPWPGARGNFGSGAAFARSRVDRVSVVQPFLMYARTAATRAGDSVSAGGGGAAAAVTAMERQDAIRARRRLGAMGSPFYERIV